MTASGLFSSHPPGLTFEPPDPGDAALSGTTDRGYRHPATLIVRLKRQQLRKNYANIRKTTQKLRCFWQSVADLTEVQPAFLHFLDKKLRFFCCFPFHVKIPSIY